MRLLLLLMTLSLAGCAGHELTGTTYRVQGGRSVSELFGTGTTTWQIGAEFHVGKGR